jgi:hypothetical protein
MQSSGEFEKAEVDNRIFYSLNKPEDFILAIVEFYPDNIHRLTASGNRSSGRRAA